MLSAPEEHEHLQHTREYARSTRVQHAHNKSIEQHCLAEMIAKRDQHTHFHGVPEESPRTSSKVIIDDHLLLIVTLLNVRHPSDGC